MAELGSTSLLTSVTNYWKFEGNSTATVGSNNGTDTNITYSTSYGYYNQGASFNGTNSQITLGSTLTTVNQNNSMTGWVYTTDDTSRWDVFANGHASELWGFTFGVGFVIQLFSVNTWASNGKYYSYTPPSFTVAKNKWYQIGYCYDHSNDKTKFFVYSPTDGKLDISSYVSPTVWGAGTKSTQNPKYFGRNTISGYWKGYMDDFGFFSNKLLSDDEIRILVYGDPTGGSPIFFGNTAIA